MIGKKIQPILKEIEDTLWEFEAHSGEKPNFPEESLASATKIFMSVMMDKLYELNIKEEMDLETSSAMAEKCGEDIRKIIKVYTGKDSHDFYK